MGGDNVLGAKLHVRGKRETFIKHALYGREKEECKEPRPLHERKRRVSARTPFIGAKRKFRKPHPIRAGKGESFSIHDPHERGNGEGIGNNAPYWWKKGKSFAKDTLYSRERERCQQARHVWPRRCDVPNGCSRDHLIVYIPHPRFWSSYMSCETPNVPTDPSREPRVVIMTCITCAHRNARGAHAS